MKCRAVVEPSTGHLKSEHRLDRNRLKGVEGNAINVVLSGAPIDFEERLVRSERKGPITNIQTA
jgi:IS5 family transposase